MHAAGVICEFNPFHSGHGYLLSRMRELVGPDGCVVCVMSGRFVQRGEAAIADPYLRAEMALAGGADLVTELPFPQSAGSAEHFALAGVRVLTRLGVESLCFGSESGDLTLLSRAADGVASPAFGETYAALCRGGTGTASAYAEALRAVCGGTFPDHFPSSNDLLGIAYLRALRQARAELGYAPAPHTVTRLGAGYRKDILTDGEYPSATALRALIREAACNPAALETIPDGTMPADALTALLDAIRRNEVPLDSRRLMEFFHILYRLKSPADCEGYAEWGGGIAAHICRHARAEATPEGFLASLRTKQFTDARLRRALLFGALEVTEQDLRREPAFTTLLAANARGCQFLRSWRRAHKDDCDFSVVTKPADAPVCRQRELTERADSLITLCFPAPRPAGDTMKRSPVILPDRQKGIL
ncbi:MAG: nucleotidyltransferase family protein [Clostridia bacterium]|nr:nucleotidyltransferase family protein [Clostridia bacterium]